MIESIDKINLKNVLAGMKLGSHIIEFDNDYEKEVYNQFWTSPENEWERQDLYSKPTGIVRREKYEKYLSEHPNAVFVWHELFYHYFIIYCASNCININFR